MSSSKPSNPGLIFATQNGDQSEIYYIDDIVDEVKNSIIGSIRAPSHLGTVDGRVDTFYAGGSILVTGIVDGKGSNLIVTNGKQSTSQSVMSDGKLCDVVGYMPQSKALERVLPSKFGYVFTKDMKFIAVEDGRGMPLRVPEAVSLHDGTYMRGAAYVIAQCNNELGKPYFKILKGGKQVVGKTDKHVDPERLASLDSVNGIILTDAYANVLSKVDKGQLYDLYDTAFRGARYTSFCGIPTNEHNVCRILAGIDYTSKGNKMGKRYSFECFRYDGGLNRYDRKNVLYFDDDFNGSIIAMQPVTDDLLATRLSKAESKGLFE